MSGRLYIVPTPVGNMSDMTPRAIEVLKSCSLVLAEDTRTSAPLMRRFEITTPMTSHHKFNEHTSVNPLVDRIESGEDIALISDAGTPGISDPGFMLSRECRRRGVEVITLPGLRPLCLLLSVRGCLVTGLHSRDFCRLKKDVEQD